MTKRVVGRDGHLKATNTADRSRLLVMNNGNHGLLLMMVHQTDCRMYDDAVVGCIPTVIVHDWQYPCCRVDIMNVATSNGTGLANIRSPTQRQMITQRIRGTR